MPYVEGFDTWPFGEEWLWEALATVYLPLARRARRRAGDARPDAGAVRPVRDARGRRRRALPARSCATCARRSTPRTPTGLERTGHPELAGEVRRAAGDYVAAERNVRATRRAAARRVRRARRAGALDVDRDPRRAAAAGDRRRPAAAGRRRASRRTSGASAATLVAAASGCPSAPTRPGLERYLAEHGVQRVLRRPDRRLGARLARPPGAGAHARPGRSRCRSTGRPSRSSGATRATRPTAATATTTAAPGTTCGRGTSPATPYRRREAQELARRTRRDFVDELRRAARRLPRRARPARPDHLRDRHRAARPLVVRGARLAARGDRRGRPPGRAAAARERRARSRRAGRARARARRRGGGRRT